MYEAEAETFNAVINEQILALENSRIMDEIEMIQYVYYGPNHERFNIKSKNFVKSAQSGESGKEHDTLNLDRKSTRLNSSH